MATCWTVIFLSIAIATKVINTSGTHEKRFIINNTNELCPPTSSVPLPSATIPQIPMLLWYGLFIKTVAIHWTCLTYYLSSHNSANCKHIDKTIVFKLSVLANGDPNEVHVLNSDNTNRNLLGIPTSKVSTAHNMDRIDEVFDEFNTHDHDDDDDDDLNNSINHKLVNTLTSGSMFNPVSHKKYSHNSDTCLLWLYNASTQQVSIIDENAKTPQPSFTAIQSLFKTMTTSQSDPITHTNAGEKLNTNRNVVQ